MTRLLTRRTVLAATLTLAASFGAFAQAYPTRPVKLVVAFAAGGPIDLAARIMADQLTEKLGQPVIVENKTGANGAIAADLVKSSPADGHTLLISNASMITITPTLKKDLKYNVERDFAPITRIVTSPLILVVNPEDPQMQNVRSVPDLIATAKRMPGQVSYGSAGLNGNVQQLAFELMATQAGVSLLSIPYKGASEAQAALLSRTVALSFDTLTAIQHIKAGKLRPLAIGAPARLEALPNVPTLAELGLAPANLTSLFGIFAPAGTPAAVLERLNAEINKALASPDLRARLVASDNVPTGGSAAEFARQIATESDNNARIIKAAGIKAG